MAQRVPASTSTLPPVVALRQVMVPVADLDATTERLRSRGVTIAGEPHLIHRDDDGDYGPPHAEEWMAFVVDSEGNTIGLSERRTPAGG